MHPASTIVMFIDMYFAFLGVMALLCSVPLIHMIGRSVMSRDLSRDVNLVVFNVPE